MGRACWASAWWRLALPNLSTPTPGICPRRSLPARRAGARASPRAPAVPARSLGVGSPDPRRTASGRQEHDSQMHARAAHIAKLCHDARLETGGTNADARHGRHRHHVRPVFYLLHILPGQRHACPGAAKVKSRQAVVRARHARQSMRATRARALPVPVRARGEAVGCCSLCAWARSVDTSPRRRARERDPAEQMNFSIPASHRCGLCRVRGCMAVGNRR